MAEKITSTAANEVGAIKNGLPGRPMRLAIENKELLAQAGSVYVGTGETNIVSVGGVEYTVPVTEGANPAINPTEGTEQYLIYDNETETTSWKTEINGAQVSTVPEATTATNYKNISGEAVSITEGIGGALNAVTALETKITTGVYQQERFAAQNANVARNYDAEEGTIQTEFQSLKDRVSTTETDITTIEDRLSKLGFKSARIYNTTFGDDNQTLVKGGQIGTIKRQGNYVIISFDRGLPAQPPVAILADEGYPLENFSPSGVDMFTEVDYGLTGKGYPRYKLSENQITYMPSQNVRNYAYLQYSTQLGGCFIIDNLIEQGNANATGVEFGRYGYEADPIQ